MNLVQITPGAGAMYCGNCLRDNALVAGLRQLGHQVLMVPLYLPLTLDETDQSAGTPIFFSGINVYLDQKSALFRHAPQWLHGMLSSRSLLHWAAGRAARTRAADLGELTLSMLRGEEGNQGRELDDLIGWLKTQRRPDVICLSNALLLGLVRRLKAALDAPVLCALQGEDTFLDALPEAHRTVCWKTLAERAQEADLFIAPSRYFADRMRQRLGLSADRVRVVYNGINLEGYDEEGQGSRAEGQRDPPSLARLSSPPTRHPSPVLGFFARMCAEKGLGTLVDAYVTLRQDGGIPGLRLKVGGSCGPADEAFVNGIQERLRTAALLREVEFHPNLDRPGKLDFLRSLSVFSVPAGYGEAFGLYVIEALAAGVPVVQPRSGAFPELIEATGGGVVCAAGDAQALAEGLRALLLHPAHARVLGQAGRQAVRARFSAEAMARATLEVCRQAMAMKGC